MKRLAGSGRISSKRLALSVFVLSTSTGVFAFEQPTHAAMTAAAWVNSNLGSPTFHQHLGILDYPGSIGDQYFDLADPLVVRGLHRLEQTIADQLTRTTNPLPDLTTFEGWSVRGAIREDDNSVQVPDTDEPGGVFTRVFGHFYDPYNNSGLTTVVGPRAVDWALDPDARVRDPLTPRPNHYGVPFAREAMWRALTMKASDGNGGFVNAPSPGGFSMTAEDVRNAYWATAFRALGDSLHLLQDMAQPQHTRNDPHAGLGCIGNACVAGGHASFFENYLLARTIKRPFFFLPDAAGQGAAIRVDPDDLSYSGYPAVSLSTYGEFFGPAGTSINAVGRGLANYSNRGFYSAGTNIGHTAAYPSPSPDGAGLTRVVVVTGLQTMTKQPLIGSVTFLTGQVPDTYTGTPDVDKRLTTVGLWDQFLQGRGPVSDFTLNYYNYNDQADLLVPRAVGYSAGLINFFFRGRLQVSLPDDGVYSIVDHAVQNTSLPVQGFSKIRLKVKNITDPVDGVPQSMSAGALAVVVKYHLNTCYTPDLAGEWGSVAMKASKGSLVFDSPENQGCRTTQEEILVSDIKAGQSLAVNEEKQLEFTFPTGVIPINATDVYLQVAFRGRIGSEADDVAVETKDIGEPAFTAYMNGTDYLFCYNGAFHYRGPNGEFPSELIGAIPTGNSDYPPIPIDAVMVAYQPNDVSPSARPLVQIGSIPPKSYIRFAVLTDLGVNWGFSANAGNISIDNTIHPSDLTREANQVYRTYDAVNHNLQVSDRARDVIHVRQHNAAAGTFFYWAQGAPCTGDYPADIYNDPPQLLPVTINNYPIP